VDLEGCFVLPGLWDSHCHLSLMIPDPTNYSRFDTEAEAAIRAGHNARHALLAGFTSLRVVGEMNGIDMAWRAAFANGMFPGPRIFAAGRLLGTTGGHGRQERLTPLRLEERTCVFDGPAEAMRAARAQIQRGADLIKIAITGGMSAHEQFAEAQMETEEIAAIVTVAHARGRRVAAHAGGGAVTKAAVRIGINSVEHGYCLDEECIELMLQNDVAFVPTIGVTHDADFARRHQWTEQTIARAAGVAPSHRAALEMAIARGIRICAGGDKYPVFDSGVREIELLASLGLGTSGALRAATAHAAALSGVDADLGTVEVGKIADLLVLRRNPLEDVSAIRDVVAVLKGGRMLVDNRGQQLHQPAVLGEGTTSIGVPLDPAAPQPTVQLCC
jgi:imidazolonepropionase-like amidohydrolase